eukprot:FR736766.1.p1 GENE.FR736766.1~~FR736766.1.p1  ORF type:complete len:101 (+),score=10.83 FR736766.1:605-907(+)
MSDNQGPEPRGSTSSKKPAAAVKDRLLLQPSEAHLFYMGRPWGEMLPLVPFNQVNCPLALPTGIIICRAKLGLTNKFTQINSPETQSRNSGGANWGSQPP